MTAPTYLRLALTLEPVPAAGCSHPRPFPAPVLRGMLGKALVDRFCPWGEPRCDARGRPAAATDLCRLAEACPYGVLFAASSTRRPPFALFVQADAHGGAADRGEPDRSVELTLYGPAWTAHAWALQSLQAALAERVGDQGGWKITAVARVHPDRTPEPLAGSDLRALPADLTPDLLGLAPEPFLTLAPVAVGLRSPTHLLLRGQPVPRDQPIPFDLLVKSTLDRFAGLYGEDASPVLGKYIRTAVEAEAAKVPLLEQDIRPAEASHHSQRSRTLLDFGGTVGRLLYAPQTDRFLPPPPRRRDPPHRQEPHLRLRPHSRSTSGTVGFGPPLPTLVEDFLPTETSC